MNQIERKLASIREDRRADYLFDTAAVSAHLGIHANKFHDRWYRTRDWLIEIGQVQPGELAVELCAILAMVEAERQRRAK